MISNTQKRQEIFNQMDAVLKQDSFYFLNSQAGRDHPSGRSKFSSYKDKEVHTQNLSQSRGLHFESEFSKAKQKIHSSRGSDAWNSKNLTGIHTYMYEVNAMPLRTSFLNSIRKRKKQFKNSIREYSKSGERSKSRTRDFRSRKSNKMLGLLNDDTIFDNLPQRIKPRLTTSVDQTRIVPIIPNSSVDFKHLPHHLQMSMQDKVSQVLQKKIARKRHLQKQAYNLSRDTRRDIADRILSKLQNWPTKAQKASKAFKKFYWTKDYSHCAFADEEEIVDGYLVKPT
jgi:hypothetical protein